MLKFSAIAALLAAFLLLGPANAAVFRIEATSVVPAFTDFVLEFDDLDGDNLYSTNEQTFFSGVTLIQPTFTIFFDELRRFEPLDGFSDDVGTGIGFRKSDLSAATGAPLSAFTFELSAVGEAPVTTVPLPAAAWMYLAGILGLGFLRRRFVSRVCLGDKLRTKQMFAATILGLALVLSGKAALAATINLNTFSFADGGQDDFFENGFLENGEVVFANRGGPISITFSNLQTSDGTGGGIVDRNGVFLGDDPLRNIIVSVDLTFSVPVIIASFRVTNLDDDVTGSFLQLSGVNGTSGPVNLEGFGEMPVDMGTIPVFLPDTPYTLTHTVSGIRQFVQIGSIELQEVAAVPLPATAFFLIGAVAGLGFFRRKHQSVKRAAPITAAWRRVSACLDFPPTIGREESAKKNHRRRGATGTDPTRRVAEGSRPTFDRSVGTSAPARL